MSAAKRLQSFLNGCKNQSPWQQRGFVFLLGALNVLALAPFYVWPILFVTFPLFLFTHDHIKTVKSGFWLGWWFGFGYFTFGLYWIANALFVDLASFWWVIPFAVMGLPFGLSFFWAIVAAFLTKADVRGVAKLLLFVALFSLTEWLRGHILTGFPWNLIGYAWVDYSALLQVTSVLGVYGLTLYTFLIAGSMYLLLIENKRKKIVLSLMAFTLLLYLWGGYRADHIQNIPTTETVIRLVQPNIAQKDKWVPEKMTDHFDKLVALSSQQSTQGLNAIIWPETATSFFDTMSIRRFEASIPEFIPKNGYLITGILDFGKNGAGQTSAYNRLGVFDSNAEPIGVYDKHHLVPFGEYLPFEKYLPFNPIAGNGVMFEPGAGARTLTFASLAPFSPLICYEAIFPNAVIGKGQDTPSWLLNLTNDGWYGRSTGPYQHLAITQTRAVEEGMPMARVANTGISAVVDASGTIIDSLPLQTAGVIDVALPGKTQTMYSRFGDLGFFMMLILIGGLGIYFKHHDD